MPTNTLAQILGPSDALGCPGDLVNGLEGCASHKGADQGSQQQGEYGPHDEKTGQLSPRHIYIA